MLKKRASQLDLSFKELRIYYSEKDYHLDDKTFEATLNLRNQNGDYNLFDCVNEAILNALAHNDWTITEPQISMFDNENFSQHRINRTYWIWDSNHCKEVRRRSFG
ncbi:MAG: hypothetical protein NC242_09730 [Roseburia sp.]|nr:hypothetical protein [Roseburia sp.]